MCDISRVTNSALTAFPECFPRYCHGDVEIFTHVLVTQLHFARPSFSTRRPHLRPSPPTLRTIQLVSRSSTDWIYRSVHPFLPPDSMIERYTDIPKSCVHLPLRLTHTSDIVSPLQSNFYGTRRWNLPLPTCSTPSRYVDLIAVRHILLALVERLAS